MLSEKGTCLKLIMCFDHMIVGVYSDFQGCEIRVLRYFELQPFYVF